MHDLLFGGNQLRNAILAHLTLDDTRANVQGLARVCQIVRLGNIQQQQVRPAL